MPQHYRDARITPIYEGTNGIQAIDLVGRKLPIEGGGVVTEFLSQIAMLDPVAAPRRRRPRARSGRNLAEALTDAGRHHELDAAATAATIRADALAGATPYLRMFSLVDRRLAHGPQALAAKQHLDAGTGDAAQHAGQAGHGPVLLRADPPAGPGPRRARPPAPARHASPSTSSDRPRSGRSRWTHVPCGSSGSPVTRVRRWSAASGRPVPRAMLAVAILSPRSSPGTGGNVPALRHHDRHRRDRRPRAGPPALARPGAATPRTSRRSRCGPSRPASSAPGSTTSSPTTRSTAATGSTTRGLDVAFGDLEGRPRHPRRHHRRRRRRRVRRPTARASACRPGSTRWRRALPLAQAIGRCGNYFNQELFGRPTTCRGACRSIRPHRPRRASTPYTTFHPTFLYEMLWNLALVRLADLARPQAGDPARAASSSSTSAATSSAGSGSSRCASTTPTHPRAARQHLDQPHRHRRGRCCSCSSAACAAVRATATSPTSTATAGIPSSGSSSPPKPPATDAESVSDADAAGRCRCRCRRRCRGRRVGARSPGRRAGRRHARRAKPGQRRADGANTEAEPGVASVVARR